MKQKKGTYGYFSGEKKRRAIITLILFAIPLLIFFTALAYFDSRENLMTIVAIVGCLPACKSMVNLLMILPRKSMSKDKYNKIHTQRGSLVMAYDLFLTSYDKNGTVDAIAVCGNQVVGYCSDAKTDTAYIAEHIQKILRGNGYQVHVKLLRDLNPFLERLQSLNRNQEQLRKDMKFSPDERYPDLSCDELIKHTILAIAL